jgi:hypothetical protein
MPGGSSGSLDTPTPPPSSGPGGSTAGDVGGTEITVIVQSPNPNINEFIYTSQPEVPGDLGQQSLSSQTQDFQARSFRSNASANIQRPWNHRFRGEREAFKFNLLIQQVLSLAAYAFYILEPWNRLMKVREFLAGTGSSSTPANSEIALIYHITLQLEFKEWQNLKDSDVRWFL